MTVAALAACDGGGGSSSPPPPREPTVGGEVPFGAAVALASNTEVVAGPAVTIRDDGTATAAWGQVGLPIAGGGIRSVPDVGARESTAGTTWTSVELLGSPTVSADTADDLILGLSLLPAGASALPSSVWLRQRPASATTDLIANARRESTGWSYESVASPPTEGDARGLVVAGGGGVEAVAWVQTVAGVPQVLVKLRTPGTGWPQAPTAVQNNPAAIGTDPALAVDEAGNVMVVWREGPPTAGIIRSSLFDTASSSWTVPTTVTVPPPPDARSPRVVSIGGGRFVATWLETDTASRVSLRSQEWSGAAWRNVVFTLENLADPVGEVQVVALPDQGALAVWRQSGRLWHNRYATGNWIGPLSVETATVGGEPLSPRLVADTSGAAILVWLVQPSGGTTDLVYAYLAPRGSVFTQPISLRRGTGSASSPALAVAPNGNAVVAWREAVAGQAQPDLLVRAYRR